MRNPLPTLALLVVCLWGAAPAQATTIVVARTASEIVIGADSKVTDTFGNDLSRRACKIRQVGNLFVRSRDSRSIARQVSAFDRFRLRHSNYGPAASATEKISILMGYLVSGLLAELPYLKSHEPEAYFKKIEGGLLFLRVIVAGFENGRPLVFVRSFRALQYNPGQIGVAVIPDDCLENCQGPVVTRYLGESDAIEGLPEETPNFWKAGLSVGVRTLIETEIAARSEYVGPPIDIVRINQNGAQWIQKKPECNDLPGPARHH